MDHLLEVITATYNHEKFIGQAIKSVVSQQTKFDFRMLIVEDCSTDGTKKVVFDYERAHPDKIKVFYNEQNAFMNGKNNWVFLFSKVKAKYVALLDGDDFWTDTTKLQKQVDFLEANPRIAGCFHDAIVVDENSKTTNDSYYKSPHKVYDQAHAIVNGGAYATCSLVFRAQILTNPPDWFLKTCSDYAIDLLITEYGDIAHIDGNMGAYRIHNKGLWQGVESSHIHAEEHVRRYFICLTNPKFRKNYGNYYYKRISELSGAIALHYAKQKQFFKKIKYAWYFIYYARPLNLKAFNYLFGTLLFASLYKRLFNLSVDK